MVKTSVLPFEIPLSDDELLLMGKIAVLWGQIDDSFNLILRVTLTVPTNVYESLLGNQMIGSRIAHLRAAGSNVPRPQVRALLKELADKLTAVLPDRNAAMHGCWGYYVQDPSYSKTKIGSFNHQKPKVRFFVTQLPKLYSDLVAIMQVCAKLEMIAVDEDPETADFNGNRIYFAPEPPDERAAGVSFRRGDRTIHVESKSRGWQKR